MHGPGQTSYRADVRECTSCGWGRVGACTVEPRGYAFTSIR